MTFDQMLPVIFMGLLGLSMLAYVVLDGFDLGVGLLMHRATTAEQNMMVASIGPFWDANETCWCSVWGSCWSLFPKRTAWC